ncbi:SDR family oxidoreductase [Rhodococcus erythropolis]|uniref:SDR family oxidoreductase n=1 Tax=Rhodococcus erythropolis TaxID=1833 RepID=A0AAX3ZXH8_RHOER|nr:SDR family oxidoreductase [Rhodococcus erythropolis]WMN01753.1 SDR family oxidoreductase [Rhodococcus erythropolis]
MGQQVTVVIGIGGMGETLARRQGPGRKLVLADFNEAALSRVADTLRGEGYDVDTHVVDVSSRESVAKLASDAAAVGTITQVAHTAGLSPTQAAAEAILKVDLAGVAFVLDEFGTVIAPGGAGVVIASMAGAISQGHFPAELEGLLAHTPCDQLLELPFLSEPSFAESNAAYAISKRGNQLRVQAASIAWGARGARINSVSPGIIATPMGQEELAGESGRQMQAMTDASAAKRLGTSGDIANAVAFLLGPDSSFITGTDLLVDGGVVAALRSGNLTIG